MNILLLGSGGREHALAWKLSQSALCSRLYIAPGNAGTLQHGTNVSLQPNDFDAVAAFVAEQNIALIIVGPEEPLVLGITDHFEGLRNSGKFSGYVIGPGKEAAQMEGSKAFSKKFMQRHNIPTAAYAEFDISNYEAGKTYITEHSLPIVLKADGLAAGKGVVICYSHKEALEEFEAMLQRSKFGKASSRVVIEQFLDGIELSVFVVTDGSDYRIIGHAKDYKRIGEGDKGLNTGGMGCVSPVPFAQGQFLQKVEERIIKPTIEGINEEGLPYKGFVFFGLINVHNEPFVIEYNCRMGDPETEVVMPLLEADLAELLLHTAKGTLQQAEVKISEKAAATVMVVSGGYPGDYKKNLIMQIPIGVPEDILLFHAGTKAGDGQTVLTNGGRVLSVTAVADNIQEASEKATRVAAQIQFEGAYFRRDIGYEFNSDL